VVRKPRAVPFGFPSGGRRKAGGHNLACVRDEAGWRRFEGAERYGRGESSSIVPLVAVSFHVHAIANGYQQLRPPCARLLRELDGRGVILRTLR